MTLAEARHLAFVDRWPTALLIAGALAAFAGWVMLHRLRRRDGAPAGNVLISFGSAVLMVLRTVLVFAGIWLAFKTMGRAFVLATNWPLWPVALTGGLLAEGLVWLYALERRVVSPAMGILLTCLRLGLLGLAAAMLVQPVRVSVSTETRKRTVAVLVDTSASMRIADRQLPAHQKLRLAEAFSVSSARRPYRLEEQADRLRQAREDLLVELGWLDGLASGKEATLREQLIARRGRLAGAISKVHKDVAQQVKPVDSVLSEVTTLSQQWRAALMDVKAALGKEVLARLSLAGEWTGRQRGEDLPKHFHRLRDALRRAVVSLGKAAPVLQRASAELDAMLYRQLGPEDRLAVDAVAGLSRLELARAILLHRPTWEQQGTGGSLLERLQRQYDVRVYTFAAAPAEADVLSWSDPVAAAVQRVQAPATAPAAEATFDDEDLQTDLAAAMGKVLVDLAAADLAGIVVLSDGQDNGRGKVEPLARQLGGLGASFCAGVLGDEKPPPDAAIIAVESPDTVCKDDRMYVSADLKLDGLDGRDVAVVLYDGDRVVDSRDVRAKGHVFRTRVQLADEPAKAGMHVYRLEVKPKHAGADPVEEVFTENNACSLVLTVTEEKTKVLLADGRPRWEFRYLKNLFSGRDKTVKLQYLLTRPDEFYGQPKLKKPVHASVKRPPGDEEATALPENEQEWMKFDVVILGDLSPADLAGKPAGKAKGAGADKAAAATMRTIRKFVSDRGGTLVLIAGPGAMPGAFGRTELAELIPVRLAARSNPGGTGRTSPQGFRIALTPEGAEHVICRQDVAGEKSQEIWNSLRPAYWRSGYTEAAPAATVLGYAVDPDAPKWLTPTAPGAASAPEGLARRRREYQRKHALFLVAPHGLGKVMMLTYDRTWRLRYRVGDTRHHKFWGQVLRWATAGKLPAGTHLVKLGSDKARYPPHSRPVVRAKIIREDMSPVVTDQIAVRVLREGRCIGRVPMKYVQDSPGMYRAALDELPPGRYRLELDCPEAAALLKEGDPKVVGTDISVDPAAPDELIELAANPHLLQRLAGLSRRGAVVPPYQAGRLLEHLPAGKISQEHRDEFRLWDSWYLLAVFCGFATAEWILRKRAGLM